MNRPYNFSAGPSALPLAVLEQAASELCDWQGTGMSVMEMSHRSPEFGRIRDQAEDDLRRLLAVPDDFAVLFMQGGATAQNALIPMNLINASHGAQADYVVGGHWSRKSWQEAQRYGDIALAASSEKPTRIDGQVYEPWCWLPPAETWSVRPGAAYLHVCANETIGGIELSELPDAAALGWADVPLVVDMSSNILTRPIDFTRVGMLYAGAQKNAGPAGVTLVVIRKDLLGHAVQACPSVFDFAQVAAAGSMFNTPPTYGIYMAGLVFQWLLAQGGVAAMETASMQKSQLLYQCIDQSSLYRNPIAPAVRSRMNIPFRLKDAALDAVFLAEAKAAGLVSLKGHKSVGGMRASLYNAMPLEGVQALVRFMQDFEVRHG